MKTMNRSILTRFRKKRATDKDALKRKKGGYTGRHAHGWSTSCQETPLNVHYPIYANMEQSAIKREHENSKLNYEIQCSRTDFSSGDRFDFKSGQHLRTCLPKVIIWLLNCPYVSQIQKIIIIIIIIIMELYKASFLCPKP